LLPGAGLHFISKGAPELKFLPSLYARNDRLVDSQQFKDYYSSNYFASTLIELLEKKDDRPFFAYLPFTAPHWPLQAPKDVIAKYKGKYDDGPDVLRSRRLEEQRKLHLLAPDVVPWPVTSEEKEWDQLTDDERAFSAKTMEIYAAMVEVMDTNIGRVVDYLESKEELDNTFVLFMSDNGAEGAIREALPILSPDAPIKFYDNSFENIGNPNSFIWYGPRWALAATAPSRLCKGFCSEGGIRCPLIVRYPHLVKPGTISHEFSTVMDILPTILDLANIQHPGSRFRGREVVEPRGKSWVEHFKAGSVIHAAQDFTGWELFGQRAIRRGNYKALYMPKADGSQKWELYDLTHDRGELKDLAEENPQVLNELIELWVQYESETGLILPENVWAISYGLGKDFGRRFLQR